MLTFSTYYSVLKILRKFYIIFTCLFGDFRIIVFFFFFYIIAQKWLTFWKKSLGAIYQLCQSMPGTEQGQAGTSRDKAGTNRDKAGTNRDKQGQTETAPFCPCLSVLVPVCRCLSLSVPVCPCLSPSVPVCPCLSLSVSLCLYICYTCISPPADDFHSLHQCEYNNSDFALLLQFPLILIFLPQ